MRTWLVVAAVGVLLSVCGCGTDPHPPSPYRVGRAVLGGRPIHVVGVDGVLDGSRWPNACTLLSDDELRGVLPQVDHIDHFPNDTKVQIRNFSGHELGMATETLAKNSDCRYQVTFKLKDNGGRVSASDPTGTVHVGEMLVGGEDVVKLNWKSDLRSGANKERMRVGGLPCYGETEHNYLACRSPTFYYSVRLNLEPQRGKDPDKPFVRIESGGRIQRFPRLGSSVTPQENKAERTQIMAKFARIINAKLR